MDIRTDKSYYRNAKPYLKRRSTDGHLKKRGSYDSMNDREKKKAVQKKANALQTSKGFRQCPLCEECILSVVLKTDTALKRILCAE